MSGPTRGEQLYDSIGELQWTQSKVNDLRGLADRVADGLLIGSEEVPNQQIAELLRAKADKIEAALGAIDAETHEDYNELVKAIQYNMSGDYGAEKVIEAWDSYGEKDC